MKKAYMIIDLQFGSTGKGLLAGYLAETEAPDTVVTAFAPNAGHTYINKEGRVFIHRMLANGIVSPNLKTVLIGAGSVIDQNVLLKEIVSCADLLQGKRLVIHPAAAVVTSMHLEEEKRNVTIGSTMKGTGAAMIQRIIRNPDDMNTAQFAIGEDYLNAIRTAGLDVCIDAKKYREAMMEAEVLQIEGAQGYSLSIYHGMYPYTTSRDVTPAQILADCCVPYSIKPEIYGTLRTYPIRVADRFNEEGKMIGTSGRGYPDQFEITWESIGLEPELTTVTKLPRRIFTFSGMQFQEALLQCAPDKLFLNFANYLSEQKLRILYDWINIMIESNKSKCEVAWLGFGSSESDIRDIQKHS